MKGGWLQNRRGLLFLFHIHFIIFPYAYNVLIIPHCPLLSLFFCLPTPSPSTVSRLLSFLSCKPFPSAMSKPPMNLQEGLGPSLCQDRISMAQTLCRSCAGSSGCGACKRAVARACLGDRAQGHSDPASGPHILTFFFLMYLGGGRWCRYPS